MYLHQIMRRSLLFIVVFFTCFSGMPLFASETPLQLFPLDNYDQNIDHWLDPTSENYSKSLVSYSYQKQRLKDLYSHTFSTSKDAESPWNKYYVEKLLNQPESIETIQKKLLQDFGNEDKKPNSIGYGENFRPYNKEWINKITDNLNAEQFHKLLHFTSENRAILVQNTYARALPTSDPHFFHFTLPGQGYPFDNLQMSALWVGTPVYVIGKTLDNSWTLVATPDLLGWVQTEAIAKVNTPFMFRWQKAAKNNLVAITQTETSIMDLHYKSLQFKAFVGSIFPLVSKKSNRFTILIPIKDEQGNAKVKQAMVTKEQAAMMPLPATPHNFSKIIKTLQNRPYGWGGLNFYNDCSLELKSLYTPFGIWLPRHSAEQLKAGKVIDKSTATMNERLEFLTQNGHPLMTIIYYRGHVLMYLGSYINPSDPTHTSIAMTYQNMWALKPADASRRAVIGQTVIFPLLKSFPEDSQLQSQADQKDFKIIYLDERPNEKISQ